MMTVNDSVNGGFLLMKFEKSSKLEKKSLVEPDIFPVFSFLVVKIDSGMEYQYRKRM